MSIFINTRPTDRAYALTQRVTAYGPTVVPLPLLKMTPIELTHADKQQLTNLLSNHYHVLVVVSPTAAQLAIDHLSDLISTKQSINPSIHQSNNQPTKQSTNYRINSLLKHTKVVAVGQATASVLDQAGIKTVVPKTANNEGMLELDEIKHLTSQNKVMIWRGQGGRRLLIDVLSQKKIQVDVVEFYQRQLPTTTKTKYQQWAIKEFGNPTQVATQTVNVLISSGEAFEHWQSIVATLMMPKLTDFDYIVLGSRLLARLHGLDLTAKQIDNLEPQTVINALV